MFRDEPIFEDPSIFFEQGRDKYVMDDLLADNCGALEEKNKSESKKSVHREIERQRRQEMAALYASLRSLLPLQYVKGKRAVCDHMEQAVNYIKDTQKKIEETKTRINKVVDANTITHSNSDCVKVNLLRDDGMEILMTTDEECYPLSKVLAYLLELGLNVTTCVSTTDHKYTFHKLHLEHNKITSIGVSELTQRLVHLINVA